MTLPDWYFRNRSREAIVDMFRLILHLRAINGFKRSEILMAFVTVCRQYNDRVLASFLLYLVRLLESEERKNR